MRTNCLREGWLECWVTLIMDMKEIQLKPNTFMNSQDWLHVTAGLAAVPFLHPDSMKLPPKVVYYIIVNFIRLKKNVGISLNLQSSSLVDALRCRRSLVQFKEQVLFTYSVLPSVLDNNDARIKIWPLPLRTFICWWDRKFSGGMLPNRFAERYYRKEWYAWNPSRAILCE